MNVMFSWEFGRLRATRATMMSHRSIAWLIRTEHHIPELKKLTNFDDNDDVMKSVYIFRFHQWLCFFWCQSALYLSGNRWSVKSSFPRRRIIVVWVCMVIVALLGNSFFLITYDIITVTSPANKILSVTCNRLAKYNFLWFNYLSWIVAFFRDFMPFITLIICNVYIISRIRASTHQRKAQMQVGQDRREKVEEAKVINWKHWATSIIVF